MTDTDASSKWTNYRLKNKWKEFGDAYMRALGESTWKDVIEACDIVLAEKEECEKCGHELEDK